MRKDPTEFRQRFDKWKSGEKVYEAGRILPEVVVTPDKKYNKFLNTLPDNLRLTPNWAYDTHRYWKLNGKPKNFELAKDRDMYTYDDRDGLYHASTIAENKDGNLEFMKPKTHGTVAYETGEYDKLPDTALFKKDYELTDDPNRPNFYMYKRRVLPKYDGGKSDDTIYMAQPSKNEIIVTADAPSVYWDGFNWIGFDKNGVRHTKGVDFNPAGAHIIKDPRQYELVRLMQAKKSDVNHTHEFAEQVRNLTTALVMNAAGGAFAPSAIPFNIGRRALDGIGAIENIASTTGGILGSNLGGSIGHYSGRGIANFVNNDEKTEQFAQTGELIGSLLGGFIGGAYPIKALSPDYSTVSNAANNSLMRKFGINVKAKPSLGVVDYSHDMLGINKRLATTVKHVYPDAKQRAMFNNAYFNQLRTQPLSIIKDGLPFKLMLSVQNKSAENLNRLSRLIVNNPEYAYYLSELQEDMSGLSGFNYLDEYAYRPDVVRDFLKRQSRAIRGTHHKNETLNYPGENMQTAKVSLTIAPKNGSGGDRLGTRGLYTSNTPTIADRFKNPLSTTMPETGYVGRLFHDLDVPEDLPIEQQLFQYRQKVYPEPEWVRKTGITRPEGIHAVEDRYISSSVGLLGDQLAGYERSYLPGNTNTIEHLDVYPESVDAHGRWGYGTNPEYDSELFIPRMFNSTTDYINLAKRFLQGRVIKNTDYLLLNKLEKQTDTRFREHERLFHKNQEAYLNYTNWLNSIKRLGVAAGMAAFGGLLPFAARGSMPKWYYVPEKDAYYDDETFDIDFSKLKPIEPRRH